MLIFLKVKVASISNLRIISKTKSNCAWSSTHNLHTYLKVHMLHVNMKSRHYFSTCNHVSLTIMSHTVRLPRAGTTQAIGETCFLITSNHGRTWDNILNWNLREKYTSFFHDSTFCTHIHDTIRHRRIGRVTKALVREVPMETKLSNPLSESIIGIVNVGEQMQLKMKSV